MDNVLADKIIELVGHKGCVSHMDRDLIEIFASSRVENGIHPTDAITDIVDSGRLVEVEYKLPNSNKIRSLYFPSGTHIIVWDNHPKDENA